MNSTVDKFARSFEILADKVRNHKATIRLREMGVVTKVGRGVVEISALKDAFNDELLRFSTNQFGYVFNLERASIGCVLLDGNGKINVGDEVRRTHRVLDVPVGHELLGRVLDPMGRPLDGKGPIETGRRMPIERSAVPIMDRSRVNRPLQTGIKVVDALVPIGRGQRQLIIGDRQTGKTSVAVDAILNQKDSDVICIYCAIGQRNAAVANVIHRLNKSGVMNECVVVVGESNATAGLQFAAPYAATTIAEFFMEQGRDVLIVYDELTAHAKAFREMSLLLRRPPGREAYPGDIFYVHARLLERVTCLRPEAGGGSITAFPIVETEADNISGYIPTNLISITDGQIYLSRNRFQKGLLPAVDVGRSVSRVGGKAQLAAYRSVAGALRLTYAQFEELEKFARFSSQLDEATRNKLRRGQRVRQLLSQSDNDPRDVVEQVVAFVAVTHGVFDSVSLENVQSVEKKITLATKQSLTEVCQTIRSGKPLSKEAIESIVSVSRSITASEVS